MQYSSFVTGTRIAGDHIGCECYCGLVIRYLGSAQKQFHCRSRSLGLGGWRLPDLQGFKSSRFNSHRGALMRTPFWGEEWALHWELLLWDENFPRGPEDKIGMLFWRLHRAARIVFSLNFQLGRWSARRTHAGGDGPRAPDAPAAHP